MTQLTHFYQRRSAASATISVGVVQQSFLLGSSVVAGRLIEIFGSHGLAALSLSLCGSYVLGSEVILPLFQAQPNLRKPITTILAMAFPVSFLATALAVSFNSVPLLYISLTGIMGSSLSVYDVFTRYEILQWWAPDGKKRIGISLAGCTAGCSAIFYTLTSGWMVTYVGFEACLWLLAGIQLVLSCILSLATYQGKLEGPPTAQEAATWLKQDDIETDTRPVTESLKDTTNDTEIIADKEPSKAVAPTDTSRCIPLVYQNRSDACQYFITWMLLAKSATTAFNGYATKVLLSSMFELIFGLPLLTSAYLSALSLVLFLGARAAVPYFLLDSRYSATFLSGIAAGTSCVGYLLVPIALQMTNGNVQLVLFVILKSVIGGCFACLSTLTSSVALDVVGQSNLKLLFRLAWPVGGVFGAAGPLVAYFVSQHLHADGLAYSEAFAPFFYAAAILAFLNTCIIVGLHAHVQGKK